MKTEELMNTNESCQNCMSISDNTTDVLNGNSAAAEGAALSRAEYIPAYPITPQTSIVEKLAEKVAEKKLNATFVNMESEHSVFSAAMGASLMGARVFTATSGQGLFYAHEVLHAIAHFRLPIVACNVGRPSIPWNIWSDQSDSMSQRDTGWIQIYGESAQEVMDSIIQSYKIAEEINMPVLIILDAFYQSHTSENILIPSQPAVDKFLPVKKANAFTNAQSFNKSFGGLVPPGYYDYFNYNFWNDLFKVEELVNKAGEDFEKIFGRKYTCVETFNIHSETRMVIVALSSVCSTIKGVLKNHPDIGLIKLRLFRPFPKNSILKIMESLSPECNIVVLDRNFVGETEGCLMQEIKRTLYARNFTIFNTYAGLGGRDIPPETINRIIEYFGQDGKLIKPVYWADIE